MDLGAQHQAAREAAARLPVLEAGLALLTGGAVGARLVLYSAPLPVAPGETPPEAAALVEIPLATGIGAVDPETYQLRLDTPLEAPITGADPATGTAAAWARIYDGHGDWWADCTVSAAGDGGEVQLDSSVLYQGASVRVTSAVFQG
ncbi:hypothetical protein [Marichromatium bheemlicum]|uniref:Uncharacterized protein n=1 Tax=Marichromatium bheemlicum TaxID=365339 RepID=A0ABX1ID06_9GAMM|nr:hypothetical protein [Marichromatium bheemlicum]NKN34225.1 hypothetical protein [Marichromatium bheemlicum]